MLSSLSVGFRTSAWHPLPEVVDAISFSSPALSYRMSQDNRARGVRSSRILIYSSAFGYAVVQMASSNNWLSSVNSLTHPIMTTLWKRLIEDVMDPESTASTTTAQRTCLACEPTRDIFQAIQDTVEIPRPGTRCGSFWCPLFAASEASSLAR